MSEEFKKEIIDLLIKGDNIKNAQQIAYLLDDSKGEMLFNFFNAILNGLTQKYPQVNISNKSRIYDKEKCKKWFSKGKRNRICNIGFFLNIGVAGILFHVQVADTWLRYGFVKVDEKINDNDNKEVNLSNEPIESCFDGFEISNWEVIKWCSKPLFDGYSDCDNLLQLSNKEYIAGFIMECLQAIKYMIENSQQSPEKTNLPGTQNGDNCDSTGTLEAEA